MKFFLNKNKLFDLFNYNNQELMNKILDNVTYPFISETSHFNEIFKLFI